VISAEVASHALYQRYELMCRFCGELDVSEGVRSSLATVQGYQIIPITEGLNQWSYASVHPNVDLNRNCGMGHKCVMPLSVAQQSRHGSIFVDRGLRWGDASP
jgi:hypothetical protein